MPSKSSKRSEARTIRAIRIHFENPENLSVIKEAVSLLKKDLGSIKVSTNRLALSHDVTEDILAQLISMRLIDPCKRDAKAIDSFALRDYENRVLAGESRARGVPYDGTGLMRFYQRNVKSADSLAEEMHIIITDRLTMTWSEDDLRYHARVAVFGAPCVISMSGLIEAPARPRDYYVSRQALEAIGAGSSSDKILAEKFSGRYLEPDDPRTGRVLHGYLFQSLFFSAFGNPFCEDKDCLLFNAHWQEEMIHAQLKSSRLCDKHKKMLMAIASEEKHIQSNRLENKPLT